MRFLLAALLGVWAAGALAAEVTVMRPKSIMADDWAFYIMVGGKPVTDLRNGERVTIQVPAETPALVIHCPKWNGGYRESRLDFDFRAQPRSFFTLSLTSECVNIRALDATAAAPVVRETVQRRTRLVDYDPGKVESTATAPAATVAAVASEASARDQVAAATAAWVDAFNSRDAARIASLYDADAVLVDATESRSRTGAAAISEYYKGVAQRSTQRVALGERSIRVFGDTAIDSGTVTLFEMRDGQATTTPARYSLTYRNRGGKWLIVDHQASLAK